MTAAEFVATVFEDPLLPASGPHQRRPGREHADRHLLLPGQGRRLIHAAPEAEQAPRAVRAARRVPQARKGGEQAVNFTALILVACVIAWVAMAVIGIVSLLAIIVKRVRS